MNGSNYRHGARRKKRVQICKICGAGRKKSAMIQVKEHPAIWTAEASFARIHLINRGTSCTL